MRRPRRIAPLALVVCAALARGADPSTQPAADAMPALLRRLADPEPAARHAARDALLALPADRIPELRAAARAGRLAPAQRSALREAVLHHALAATRPDGPAAAGGILGITVPGGAERFARDDDGNPAGGLRVLDTVPGYDAYRALRPGDRIRGSYLGDTRVPILDFAMLRAAVASRPPGTVLALDVERADGTRERCPVRLAPAPLGGDATVTPERLEDAERAWRGWLNAVEAS